MAPPDAAAVLADAVAFRQRRRSPPRLRQGAAALPLASFAFADRLGDGPPPTAAIPSERSPRGPAQRRHARRAAGPPAAAPRSAFAERVAAAEARWRMRLVAGAFATGGADVRAVLSSHAPVASLAVTALSRPGSAAEVLADADAAPSAGPPCRVTPRPTSAAFRPRTLTLFGAEGLPVAGVRLPVHGSCRPGRVLKPPSCAAPAPRMPLAPSPPRAASAAGRPARAATPGAALPWGHVVPLVTLADGLGPAPPAVATALLRRAASPKPLEFDPRTVPLAQRHVVLDLR